VTSSNAVFEVAIRVKSMYTIKIVTKNEEKSENV